MAKQGRTDGRRVLRLDQRKVTRSFSLDRDFLCSIKKDFFEVTFSRVVIVCTNDITY